MVAGTQRTTLSVSSRVSLYTHKGYATAASLHCTSPTSPHGSKSSLSPHHRDGSTHTAGRRTRRVRMTRTRPSAVSDTRPATREGCRGRRVWRRRGSWRLCVWSYKRIGWLASTTSSEVGVSLHRRVDPYCFCSIGIEKCVAWAIIRPRDRMHAIPINVPAMMSPTLWKVMLPTRGTMTRWRRHIGQRWVVGIRRSKCPYAVLFHPALGMCDWVHGGGWIRFGYCYCYCCCCRVWRSLVARAELWREGMVTWLSIDNAKVGRSRRSIGRMTGKGWWADARPKRLLIHPLPPFWQSDLSIAPPSLTSLELEGNSSLIFQQSPNLFSQPNLEMKIVGLELQCGT